MNYLAHLYLSYPDPELMTGNFIADAVKGDDYNDYPERIKHGILMHRAIDDFTDHHPLVLECKRWFTKEFDKYSGVLIDIYFDHLLAKHFSRYSDLSLAEFASRAYIILREHEAVFPEKSAQFYGYMIKENILERYGEAEGIKKVLQGLTHRINKRFLLYESIPAFIEAEPELFSRFAPFFKELEQYVAHFRV